MPWPEVVIDEIKHDTEELFTRAINLSFEPVSRLGAVGIQLLFNKYQDRLPFDETTTQPEDEFLALDPATQSALNAMHALLKARRANLDDIEPDESRRHTFDHFYVATAPTFVLDEVARMQQLLAEKTGGMYIDTSSIGVRPNPVLNLE